MYVRTFILYVTIAAAIQAYGTNAKHNINDRIKYPGPIQEYTETRYGSDADDDIPDECKDKTYCTIKPKNYPQEKFDKLIKYKSVKFSEIEERHKRSVGEEENITNKSTNDTKVPIAQPDTEVSDLIDKQGDPDEVDNCETQVEFEPLYKVKTRAGDWRNVVQSPSKNFVQQVRTETCRERDAPCFTIFASMPHYTTFCKQKFTTWHFVVEVPDSDQTEKISVDLPTCCSCHYKPTD